MPIGGALLARVAGVAPLARLNVLVAQWRPTSTVTTHSRDSVHVPPTPPTYWREGAVIGAAVVGTTTA